MSILGSETKRFARLEIRSDGMSHVYQIGHGQSKIVVIVSIKGIVHLFIPKHLPLELVRPVLKPFFLGHEIDIEYQK
jgi:hypothetical protein